MKESVFQVGVTVDKSGRINIICQQNILPGFPDGLDKFIMSYLEIAEFHWNQKH